LHLWSNLLEVFYPMPLGGRIASLREEEKTSIARFLSSLNMEVRDKEYHLLSQRMIRVNA